MALQPGQIDDRPISGRSLAIAAALHVVMFVFFWVMAKVAYRTPDVIIPIDMTIVSPWAEQTDDPDPDPNPPPKEEPKPQPPQPKPPEPEKVETTKVPAVVQEKPKEKPKPIDLRDKARLVKTSPKPDKPPDLRDKAKKVDAPPMQKTGKATAADKPLSPEEFMRLMNQGYRIGSKNQLAANEFQMCVSMVAQAIRREWLKERFSWNPGLVPLQVQLSLGPGGRVRGYRILKGSGDPEVVRTAAAALRRLVSIPGLTAEFLSRFPELPIMMEPVANEM